VALFAGLPSVGGIAPLYGGAEDTEKAQVKGDLGFFGVLSIAGRNPICSVLAGPGA